MTCANSRSSFTALTSQPELNGRHGCVLLFEPGRQRYGVRALGAKLAETLGIEHQFIDVDNPA